MAFSGMAYPFEVTIEKSARLTVTFHRLRPSVSHGDDAHNQNMVLFCGNICPTFASRKSGCSSSETRRDRNCVTGSALFDICIACTLPSCVIPNNPAAGLVKYKFVDKDERDMGGTMSDTMVEEYGPPGGVTMKR
jgi:hypothetical protein